MRWFYFFFPFVNLSKRRSLPFSAESLASLPRHMCLGSSMGAMRKTGLGSSAALVTSLVAAICVHFGAADVTVSDDLEQLHQLAQFAHCLAQGKIGSGFDVSSASFGSQKYVRFSPSHLDEFLRAAEAGNPVHLGSLFRPWDNVHEALGLPRGMQLVLGDVSVGSNTPLMVSKVLAWRAAHQEEADKLWREINEQNEVVATCLAALRELNEAALVRCASLRAAQWLAEGGAEGAQLHRLRTAFVAARKGLKRMGELAGVPIEPDEQSALCDASMDVIGVVVCGVPGAGGHDAVAALLVGPPEPLQQLWASWKQATVLPMLVRENPRGVVVEQTHT